MLDFLVVDIDSRHIMSAFTAESVGKFCNSASIKSIDVALVFHSFKIGFSCVPILCPWESLKAALKFI